VEEAGRGGRNGQAAHGTARHGTENGDGDGDGDGGGGDDGALPRSLNPL